MSCNRCSETSSDPNNFLLSCSECGKRWHHRCHLPPLSNDELTLLIRATNKNDVDNGLSSWVGKCCRRRKRVQLSEKAAVSRPAEEPKSQVHSVSPAPAVSPNAASIRQLSQKPDLLSAPTQSTHRHDQTRASTSREGGVTAPPKHDGGHALLGPQTPTESQMTTTFVRPTVQRSMTVSPDIVVVQPERSRTMPLPSTSYTATPSSNALVSDLVADSHPAHLREKNSLPLARTPPRQPTGPTYVQVHSRSSSKRASTSRSVEPGQARSEPMDIDNDLPTLDLHALTLNRAPLSHHKTTARTHSPAAAAAEDDEIEELPGPPSGFPSAHAHAPSSLPPRESSPPPRPVQPAAPKPRLLPVLATEDPRILATLERHERREAARPRQGMHKAPAVRRAGAKRGGFVLVADADRTEVARATDACREPRGVFASYFTRSRV